MKIITEQSKTLKTKILLTKNQLLEHLKIYHKLFKTIVQAEKVSQVGSDKKFLNKKNVKIKRLYENSYNVEIWNSFNPKVRDLLSELKRFKLVTTLV